MQTTTVNIPPCTTEFCRSTFLKHLSAGLIFVRRQLGVNQMTMAKWMAVSRSQYSRYENAQDIPKLHTILLWSLHTGVPVRFLLCGDSFQIGQLSDRLKLLHLANTGDQSVCQILSTLLDPLTKQHDSLQSLQANKESIEKRLLDNTAFYKTFAIRLIKCRLRSRLTQEYVAEQLGVQLETYQALELRSHPTKPSFLTWFKLSEQFDSSASASLVGALVNHYQDRMLNNAVLIIALTQKQSTRDRQALNELCQRLRTYWDYMMPTARNPNLLGNQRTATNIS